MNRELVALLLTRVLQAVVAWFFAFGLMFSLRVGGGVELLVFAAAAALAIWAVGMGCEYLFYKFTLSSFDTLPMVLIGTGLGASVLLVPNIAFGFKGLLLPIIGGLAAYHFSVRGKGQVK